MTYGLPAAVAGEISVWIALSERGGPHAEAAAALRADVELALPGRVEWRVDLWSSFTAPKQEPHWIVAVGSLAQKGMQDLFARDPTPPPLLAILVPRLAFERMADPARLRAGAMSSVFLDQPASRQLELIRLALPEARKVGVLFGAESRGQLAPLERAARERGLQLVGAAVDPADIYPALQSVLQDVNVLLAVPDPGVFNSQTATNILMAAYRRQVPLAGFSPAYVKAGALFALYSTPTQIGVHGSQMLREAFLGKALPPPQPPRDFVIRVNQDVGRSLGLLLDEARLAERLRLADRP